MPSYKTVFLDSAYNTALAAGAAEVLTSNRNERGNYAPFNFLVVMNRDDVDTKIMLDGLDADGKFYELKKGNTLILEPEDNETFSFLKQENLDSATAQTADKILFKWGRKIKLKD